MSFSDIIKKSVLESFSTADMSAKYVSVVLIETFLIALYIFMVYRFITRSSFYNKNYAISMAIISEITAGIILAMQSNLVISLGMVGALSIVRFRTAIKEPLDLMYLFWAITCGITAGASMYILAVAAFIIMFIVIVIFGRRNATGKTYVMIVHYNGADGEGKIIREISDLKYNIRSKVERSEDTELTVQLQIRKGNLNFTEKIKALDEVRDVAVLNFDGEYH